MKKITVYVWGDHQGLDESEAHYEVQPYMEDITNAAGGHVNHVANRLKEVIAVYDCEVVVGRHPDGAKVPLGKEAEKELAFLWEEGD